MVVAQLEPGDVPENQAAARVAAAFAGAGVYVEAPFTGRANLFAEVAGVLRIDRRAVDALNRLDPAVTLATLPEFAAVEVGRMVATVKIIPFAVPAAVLAAVGALAAGSALLSVAPYRPARVGLVATQGPALKPSTMDKTRRVLEDRLRPSGSVIVEERRVPHLSGDVAAVLRALKTGGHDLLIIFGASAVADARDVVPAGIELAGGTIRHLGMPVDPGNLLILADLGGTPVLGAPGCARSPQENGFDWVLRWLLARIPIGPTDITGMGVGGLLTEIVSRPQTRLGPIRIEESDEPLD